MKTSLARLSLHAAICSLPALAAVGPTAPDHDKLNTLIAEHTAQYNFRGTILVEMDGEILHDASYGLANFTFEVPNHKDTKYKIASITKTFTTVLVLMLAEEGKLALDASVATYLPDYHGEGADRVSLHHLLTHTSGRRNMESFGVEMFTKPWLGVYGKPHTVEQIVSGYCSGPLVHDPGTIFEYDNGEFILLGQVIEAVTGKTYLELLNERILVPLDMVHSGMLNHAEVVPGLADTYSWNRDAQRLDRDKPMFIENWGAAGAMYSTVGDLSRFTKALFDFRLITLESLDLMLTPFLDEYGYGLWIRERTFGDESFRYAVRYGRIRGANAVLVRHLDVDLTIIILANTTRTDMAYFASRINEVLLGS
jgi:D-alanyl-D-alanine carboxypeptidase